MNWENFRLSTRLNLKPEVIESIYELLSTIDGVKNSWSITAKLLPQTLMKLTQSLIITSTGASNRIEGNSLSDEQVEALYKNLRIKKFKTRDEQEVIGYIQAFELILEHFKEISLTESFILQLHQILLQESDKDAGHRGHYKIGSNRVEAKDQSGNIIGIIFEPTPPYLVKKEMSELIEWYSWAQENNFKHPLILIANFIFEFLAIHPFQDGNGRTSRLLTNFLLLSNNYGFASIVSNEKIVETNKLDYYRALNKTQKSWKTHEEDISLWLLFFLKVLKLQAEKALSLVSEEKTDHLLSVKQAAVLEWLQSRTLSEFSRQDAIQELNFAPRTIEDSIKKLVELNYLQRLGQGKATRYRLLKK